MENTNSEWKKELGKIAAVAIATLICLMFIVNYDASVWNMIFAVAIIATVSWLCERKPTVDRCPMRDKAVLITGCDTGFGHELAISLSIQGAEVYAACLNKESEGALSLPEKGSASRLHVLQMDITKMEEIEQVKEYIQKRVGQKGLWGVVNNAGLNFLGDIELTTMEMFERVTSINYLGMVRVTKTFIPLVRTAKGRFVNVTSVKGLFGEPFCGAYCASKFAGEGFTDILRMEMKKFDVSVSVIEPCNFGSATNCLDVDRIKKDFDTMWLNLSPDQQSLYGSDYFSAHINALSDYIPTSSLKAYLVTDAMEDALFNVKPKTRYFIPGGSGWIEMYRWRAYLKPFLPDWVMDYWILKDFKDFPKPTVHK